MLAQVYVNTTQFPYCPRRYLRRKHRLALTKNLLQSLQVDILCLQEVDCYNEIETCLREKGYQGVFQLRGGTKKDGCAIFFRSDKLELAAQHSWDCDQIRLPIVQPFCHQDWNPYLDVRHKRNNIGQCIWLRWKQEPKVSFCIANVHLFWDPIHEDVKLLQALQAVHEIDEFIHRCKADSDKNEETIDVFLMGDFNTSPGTPVYSLLTNGQVTWQGREEEEEEIMESYYLHRSKTVQVHNYDSDYHERREEDSWNNNHNNIMSSWSPIFARHATISIPFCFQSAICSVLGKEIEWSNRTEKFTDTIDYIFYTGRCMKPVQVIPCPDFLQRYDHYLPNENFPSDHIPLGCRFELVPNE
jgi:CCR4-NOT transcription complex subunit 6